MARTKKPDFEKYRRELVEYLEDKYTVKIDGDHVDYRMTSATGIDIHHAIGDVMEAAYELTKTVNELKSRSSLELRKRTECRRKEFDYLLSPK